MKRRIILVFVTVFAILAMAVAGCGAPSPAGATGNIEVRVTDAPPNGEVTSVNVTISSVEIHKAGANQTDENGWLPMKLSGANTFDLLQIKGLESVLATGDLAAGNYTQIRMNVTEVEVTLKGGEPEEATLPSGKLKFIQPFDVVAGKDTVLLFDFDAARSINVTGNGKVIFKPVIKLIVTNTPGAMEITTPSLPNGEAGVVYNATLTAMGGKTPYTWNIGTGNLPGGLSLNVTTGTINGTPTAEGNYTFTVLVQDSTSALKKNAIKSFTVNIAAAGALQITTTSLPDGTVGVAYNATIEAVGGEGSYSWNISDGSFPAGLTLDASSGAISGTPTSNGDFNFTVTLTDSASPAANSDTQNLTIHIAQEVSTV